MLTTTYSALLWPALLLVGVPILIHLINMMRHRRVQWAAMEFLLLSQKKNRTWVLLKQLLLLLMRMAAIAVVILLVAHPKLQNALGNWFGTTKTHHIVLLDDSFSMSDRWGDTSALDEGKKVVRQIATQAAAQSTPQLFTLMRFSQASNGSGGTQPDFLQEQVDTDYPERLGQVLDPIEASETAAEPLPALTQMAQLLGKSEGDRRILYVISDFRKRQWGEPDDVKKRLAELTETGAKLSLINCVDAARPNLAITNLTPAPGTRAAGISMFMELSVKNYGDTPLKDVALTLEMDGEPSPGASIPLIPAGDLVKKRFQVHFPNAGQHEIVARLPNDVVMADNFRYEVLDLPTGVPVLLIDGDPDALDARFLKIALESDPRARTGINPRIELPRFLSLNPLEEFHAIYLANIERLDQSAVKALEKYVSDGGGLAIFLGPRSRAKFINDVLYRDGQGLFPVPLSGPAVLRVDHLERAPDMEIIEEKHPIFRILADDKYRFLAMTSVQQYFAVPKGWTPKADAAVDVLAQLRGGAPLAVEQSFGRGRVVAVLTSAAPIWNDWARNPSFVVAMLEMQAYIGTQPAGAESHQVGAPLDVRFDPGQYQRQVRFLTPDQQAGPTATTDAVPTKDGALAVALAETGHSGFYKVRLEKKDGKPEERCYAFNVDAQEGDLATVTRNELAAGLAPVKFQYAAAKEFQYSVEDGGRDLFEYFLYFLILLLIGEQILAWSASYHPPTRQPALGKGGAR